MTWTYNQPLPAMHSKVKMILLISSDKIVLERLELIEMTLSPHTCFIAYFFIVCSCCPVARFINGALAGALAQVLAFLCLSFRFQLFLMVFAQWFLS